VMGSVVMALGSHNKTFVTGCCVNIVVAANAGGAFSPFGDITTLMIWQKGVVKFSEFFVLFLPAFISWVVPATIIAFSIPNTRPEATHEVETLKRGGGVIVGLFLFTIVMTILLHQTLHLPPCFGMMLGLGLLKIYGHVLRLKERRALVLEPTDSSLASDHKLFDIFDSLRDIEWDTLLFFYGIILCIGGIGALGYLTALSHFLYDGMGATTANILLGLLSAILDNIPLTFAVLSMEPVMSHGEWLLLTLTVGIGGSLLAIGSAAGVALLGVSRGAYSFFSHLKWSGVIFLGYVLGIGAHFLLNGALFNIAE
jgi:Na+/H+ antiporter NhaD/arsenite permease-like protein